ncbi:hypothetical protein CXP39_01470 [Mesoplasma syrphidae]|uniref:Uncharacterized protein n=1 Tax=Mesoplasma syrphidae TaxID=225999 RepID=A0A2K9C5A4_9MOLU|nr:hypothetical protein [Mesoplasma syrphidae]AUF83467.1 hypothetical protein CXP39_01470 [Mesoplasma syrphidae]
MDEYFRVQENFNLTSVAKQNCTKFEGYQINWCFEGFPKLISKPSFLTYLQTSFDYQFSSLMIDAIEQEIDKIRFLFNQVDEATKRYLNELGDVAIITRNYSRFLLNAYSDLKNFVNETLINWVFYNALHEDWKEKTMRYDTEIFYQARFKKLELDFQNNLKKTLKAIYKLIPNDQTIKLMIATYEADMKQKELCIVKLRSQAKLNK